ncbi:MAG: DUF4342 domain-containing protein [Anaerolineae bacterium]|nr:DUF4342 domain-containing protein [Anaerolineae bacterium]
MNEDEVRQEVEEAAGKVEEAGKTVTEEIKVQAEDLFDTINSIIREGTARRVTIMRNDRVLLDIPLVLGLGASVILAMYLPVISALAGLGVLLSGATLRIERDEPTG